MRKVCVYLLVGLVCFAGQARAVSILFGGDFFPDNTGAGIPDGAMVQLIVSTTNDSFGDPTADSFVGEPDDLVLAEATASSFFGLFNDGITSGFLANRGFDAVFGPGDRLLFRWWPTLASGAPEPGSGTAFGQFRPLDDSVVTDGSNHPFVVPVGESDNIELRMNVDFMGNLTNPGGDIALNDIQFGTVDGVVVPEPSRPLLVLGGGITALLCSRRTRTPRRS